jgi:hypothetical protein
MAATDLHPSDAVPAPVVAPAAAATWGNSAPLGLAAFAVTTFILSMVNANFVNVGVEFAAFAVALMFGGLTQLIAGIIQFHNGNTFNGVLFCTFGAFWLSLFALVQFFLKDIPAIQVGHTLGIFLIAFGIFTAWLLVAAFRTNVVVIVALADLAATLFVLGAGNYNGSTTTIHVGGYLGLVVAFLAAYLSCAELCEASYKRSVLPVWPLAAH